METAAAFVDQYERALKESARLRAEIGNERERYAKLEAPLLDWLDFQSSANSHALYCAAMEHFGRTPVLPD